LDFFRMDQVALMDKGRIIASGTHHDLMRADDRYRRIVSKMA